MLTRSNTIRCIIACSWTFEQYMQLIPQEVYDFLPAHVWMLVAQCAEPRFIYAGFDWIICIKNSLFDRAPSKRLCGHSGPIYDLSACKNQLVSASWDGCVGVWDLVTYNLVYMLHIGQTSISGVALNATTCAAVAWDGKLRVWNTCHPWTLRYTVSVTESRYWLLSVLFAKSVIVTCDDSGTIFMLHQQTGALMARIASCFASRVAMTLCRDYLILQYLNGQMSVMNLHTQKVVRVIWCPAAITALSCNNAYLVATYLDNSIYAWDISSDNVWTWSFIGKTLPINMNENVHAIVSGQNIVYGLSDRQLYSKTLKYW
jgi:WD40 repeat protein